jgi:uncharacterized membrane protein
MAAAISLMNRDPERPRPAAGTAPQLALLPPFLARFLRKYPGLARHPHPLTVHFPIVFFYSAAFLDIVYLAAGLSSCETSAFHFLAAGLLSLPPTMVTGQLVRRLAYADEPLKTFHIEIFYSRVLLFLSLIAFAWRGLDPSILTDFDWASPFYLALVLALPALATYISYFGGLLTFPLNEDR